MTILATVAIDSESFALGEVLSNSGTATRIELVQFIPIDDNLVLYL